MKLKSLSLAIVVASFATTANAFTVLSSGHYDLGVALEAGELEPHIHGHAGGGVEYGPEEAGFWVKDNHLQARPAAAGYSAVGVSAGQNFYRLRANNVAGQIYLGIGTEEIATGTLDSYFLDDARVEERYGDKNGEWVKLALKSVSGPTGGVFSMFEGGNSSIGTVWATTNNGIDASDFFALAAGGHEHVNFGFSLPGQYGITFTATAKVGGSFINKDVTYIFGVGDNFEPVPEPATMAVLGLGFAALMRKRKKA